MGDDPFYGWILSQR